MTVEVMNEVVQSYCRLRHGCTGCRIKEICDLICGDFERCQDECKRAYEIIKDLHKEQPDNVNHPKHYETGKFECIDVMVETQGEETVKAYCLCAAFKYLYRHNRKNGLEDIKKARWYLDKYIEMEGGSDDKT